MSNDVLPSDDAHFDDFQAQFVAKVVADPERYNHTPQQVAALKAAQARWCTSYTNVKRLGLEWDAGKGAKDTDKADYGKVLRASVRIVNAAPEVDNALRAEVAIRPHATGRQGGGPATTRPVTHIRNLGSRRHELHWVDETTPHSRRKPQGVEAAEIFLKIGDGAPSDETTCVRIARDTASPYVFDFEVEDVGKTAHWMLRWVNSKDEPGPFGAVVSATITP